MASPPNRNPLFTAFALVGLMFGPVVWFALLMSGLLIGCYAPERWLRRLFSR